MSALEIYESADSLKALAREMPLSSNIVRCLVTGTIPTRPCEFRSGLVFTATGSLRKHTAGVNGDEGTVRLNFYDEWAHAASFMDAGDVLILKGFAIHKSTGMAGGILSAADQPAETVLVALQASSSLRVLQPADLGDTMEVSVGPKNFDAPCVRVLPRLDHSNRVFINDVRKTPATKA